MPKDGFFLYCLGGSWIIGTWPGTSRETTTATSNPAVSLLELRSIAMLNGLYDGVIEAELILPRLCFEAMLGVMITLSKGHRFCGWSIG